MEHRQTRLFGVLTVSLAIVAAGLWAGLADAQPFGPASSGKVAMETFPEVNDLPVRKEMPDVMTMNDGTKVTTVAQWRARREEMKAILEHYELGHAPPPPGNVSGEDIQSRILPDGTVKYRLVHLKFGPEEKLGFDIAIFTPAKGGPFPTIINPSFFNTPGVAVTNQSLHNPPATTSYHQFTARPRFNFNAPVTPERAAAGFRTSSVAVMRL